MDIYSQAGIKCLLRENEYFLSRYRGQNYLVSERVSKKIVEFVVSFVQNPEETEVLEVGSGLGAITVPLAKTFRKVIAVEVDRGISKCLESVLEHYNVRERVKVLNADFLELDPKEVLGEVVGSAVFVSNLPYSVGGEILRKVFYEYPMDRLFVTVQKEFYDRMIAKEGTSTYSFVSVMFRMNAAKINKLLDIGRGYFFPVPSVDSVFIYLERSSELLDEKLARVIQKLFTMRRKNILNSISFSFGLPKDEVQSILQELGLDRNMRVENLSPQILRDLGVKLLESRAFHHQL